MSIKGTIKTIAAAAVMLGLSFGGVTAASASTGAFEAQPMKAGLGSAKKVHYCTGVEHDKKVTAKKVIEVRNLHKSGKKRDDAKMWLCEKKGKRYVRVQGGSGWHANGGYNGFTSKKREGDGKTPTGVFTMKAGFGTSKKPSQFKHGSYTKVTRDYVWVDGKHKKKYNTMQRKSKGYSGEPLYQKPAYTYAQVIGYNPKNVPGKGSGIFLHVHTGSGKTAGCVSINKSRMKKVYKWEGNSKIQIKIH